jgi:hypothetical protein
VGLEFELKFLCFAKQVLYHFSYTSSPLCFGCFGDGSLSNYLSGLTLTSDLPLSAYQVAGISGMNHGHSASDAFFKNSLIEV